MKSFLIFFGRALIQLMTAGNLQIEVLNMQPRYFIIMKIKKSLLKNQGRRYKSSLTSLLQPKYYRQNHFILLKYIIRILPTKTRHFISNIMQVLEEKVILKKSGRNRIPRIN